MFGYTSILYGYSPKPNQKKKRITGSYVTINEVGLRSINSWRSEKKKILFLGLNPYMSFNVGIYK